MTRRTSSFSMNIPVTAIKVLDKNPYRLLYSIQNRDLANYICLGTGGYVTAGVFALNEGQALAAGQPMSDDTDLAEVWAIAVAAAGAAGVNISVVEISELPKEEHHSVRRPSLRPEERAELRREARTF